jgi:hypothetical protein
LLPKSLLAFHLPNVQAVKRTSRSQLRRISFTRVAHACCGVPNSCFNLPLIAPSVLLLNSSASKRSRVNVPPAPPISRTLL